MANHFVAWGGTTVPTFTCEADPLDPCRFACPECDRWSYCGGFMDAYYNNCDGTHPLSPHCHCGARLTSRDCSAVEWIDAVGNEDVYDGDFPIPVHDGPVEIVWDGDSYLWSYVDAPVSAG